MHSLQSAAFYSAILFGDYNTLISVLFFHFIYLFLCRTNKRKIAPIKVKSFSEDFITASKCYSKLIRWVIIMAKWLYNLVKNVEIFRKKVSIERFIDISYQISGMCDMLSDWKWFFFAICALNSTEYDDITHCHLTQFLPNFQFSSNFNYNMRFMVMHAIFFWAVSFSLQSSPNSD